MGTIKTTNIQSISGSGTVTLGTSGETFNVPSGVTISNSGTASGFGITSAQEFRLAADQAGSGSAGTVLTNWEENDTDYQGIGSNWSESSGVFSCSATGIYTVCWTLAVAVTTAAADAMDPGIQISTNSGGAYTTRASSWGYIRSDQWADSLGNTFMFDVADTSTFRLKFLESISNDVDANTTIKGSSTESQTNMVFIRLGDT